MNIGGFSFLRVLQEKQRADERTRTADLISLRVISQALQRFAHGCKTRLRSDPVTAKGSRCALWPSLSLLKILVLAGNSKVGDALSNQRPPPCKLGRGFLVRSVLFGNPAYLSVFRHSSSSANPVVVGSVRLRVQHGCSTLLPPMREITVSAIENALSQTQLR
jgi:hypothetical protein